MGTIIGILAVVVFIALAFAVLAGLVYSSLYKKVPQGKALVVSTARNVEVTFTGRLVIPVIHKAEMMDISVKTIEIDRRATEGLICEDNIRADIKVNFFVRVNKAEEDVIKVAQAIGCDRASQVETLEELFTAKFSEALKTVGKQMEFISLYTERANFRDRIIEVIGTDLNGYSLEDVAIDFLEQTPLNQLDADNILDSQGIRKITELTAIEKVATNNASNDERKQITAKNVETREAVLELERQQADAEARQRREIEGVQAREQATIDTITAEERLRAEMAGIEVDQKLGIERENLQREVEVAAKNRERVLAVEEERVRKAAELEDMSRQVETLAAEKALEQEMGTIAEIRRSRIAVDKTVAEQEEAIETLRMAEHLAAEDVRMAKGRMEASNLDAAAKIKLAEGVQAESAAVGLAEVEVLEARAEIVGGSDIFIDKLVGAISTGKAVDGFVEGSDLASASLEKYQNGDEDLVAKISEAVAGLGADGIRDLSVADLLRQLGK